MYAHIHTYTHTYVFLFVYQKIRYNFLMYSFGNRSLLKALHNSVGRWAICNGGGCPFY